MSKSSRIRPDHDDDVVEYLVKKLPNNATIELFAVRKRPDKKIANSLYVFTATVQDVLDDVRVEELYAGTHDAMEL